MAQIVENQEPPTSEVLTMVEQGISNEEIITALQGRGYSNTQISEAINQANTKTSVEGNNIQRMPTEPARGLQRSVLDAPDVPQPPQEPQGYNAPTLGSPSGTVGEVNRGTLERIEEIAESIIDEKWKHVIEDIGDLGAWKEKIKTDITSIKQELVRLETRFSSMQQAVLRKVGQYDEGIEEVGTDIKALEKLLKAIINPLTTNVKELKALTEKLKK